MGNSSSAPPPVTLDSIKNAFDPNSNGIAASVTKTNAAAATTLDPSKNGVADSVAKTNAAASTTLDPSKNGVADSVAKTNAAASTTLDPSKNGVANSVAKTNNATLQILDPNRNGLNASIARTNDASLQALDPLRNGLTASTNASFSPDNMRAIRQSFTDQNGVGNILTKVLTLGTIDPSALAGVPPPSAAYQGDSTLASASSIQSSSPIPSSSYSGYTDKSADPNTDTLSPPPSQTQFSSGATTLPNTAGYSMASMILGISLVVVIGIVISRKKV